MKDPELTYKLRHIYLRYVILTFSCIVFYSLANWSLTMRENIFSFKENLVNDFLPFPFALVCSLIFLYPKIRLLHVIDTKGADARFLVLLVAAATIGASIVNAQSYLLDATGKFTHLKSINEITTSPKGRFYTVKNFYIDQAHPLKHFVSHYSGKNSTDLDFNYYILFPLYNSDADTNKAYDALLGVHFDDSRTNPKNIDIERQSANDFITKSDATYDWNKFWQFDYFINIGNTDERDAFLNMLAISGLRSNTPILTIPKNSYEQELKNHAFWFLIILTLSFAAGAIFIITADLKNGVISSS